MTKIKGNFKFSVDRIENDQYVIPFRYVVRYDGKTDGFKYVIENQLGINIKEYRYLRDNTVFFKFEEDLSSGETAQLFNIIDEYKQKDDYTPIELEGKKWEDAKYPVRDVLPTIEGNLKTLYDASVWGNLNFCEKRILAYWRVCTDAQALEVFTQAELDSFRWYTIYKYLTNKQREMLSKEDIYEPPKKYDFKRDFEDVYFKKRFPFVKGRPTKKEYYASYDITGFTYDQKFAELNFSFIDEDGTDLILRKIANLAWMFNDGTMDYDNQKDIGEIFNPFSDGILRIEESEHKRRNIFDSLKANSIGMIAMTSGVTVATAIALGVDFIENYKTEFDNWIELGSDRQDELVTAITNDVTHPWLNNFIDGNGTTIRMYIISEVQIK